jgi:thioredoxin 1
MRYLFILLHYFLLFACTNGEGQGLLPPSEFEKKMHTEKGILLDVRTGEEFSAAHLHSASNIDFYSPQFEAEIQKLDKSKTYFLYCQRGKRSSEALALFKKNGFINVYSLDGGMLNWEKEGKAVEKVKTEGAKGISVSKYEELIRSQPIVLVDFSAKWCGPCRKLSPELESFGKKRSQDVKVVMIDVDENPIIAQQYKIDEVPTLIWYKNGTQALRMIGYYDPKYIEDTLNGLIKK